jgi:hypothetical protein
MEDFLLHFVSVSFAYHVGILDPLGRPFWAFGGGVASVR